VNLIADRSQDFYQDPYGWIYLGNIAGTRPIGEDTGRLAGNLISSSIVTPRVLTLTYDAALRAVTSTPSNLGYGVIAINYADQYDHGDYTLYVQVEQIK